MKHSRNQPQNTTNVDGNQTEEESRAEIDPTEPGDLKNRIEWMEIKKNQSCTNERDALPKNTLL